MRYQNALWATKLIQARKCFTSKHLHESFSDSTLMYIRVGPWTKLLYFSKFTNSQRVLIFSCSPAWRLSSMSLLLSLLNSVCRKNSVTHLSCSFYFSGTYSEALTEFFLFLILTFWWYTHIYIVYNYINASYLLAQYNNKVWTWS